MKTKQLKEVGFFCAIAIVAAFLSSCPNRAAPAVSGYGDYECVKNILGRGYDVFGNYADPDDTRSAILNFDALYKDGQLEKSPRETTEYETVSGTSASNYASNMATRVSLSGSYKYFSGSVKTAFSSAKASSSFYQYATVQAIVEKDAYLVSNRTSVSDLKKYLTAQFAADLNGSDMTPDELFIKYGTHVMTGVVTGGRLDYNLSAHNGSSSSSESIGVYAQARFKTAFAKATASCSYDTAAASSTSFTDITTTTKAKGGNSTDSVGDSDANFCTWLKTIDSKPVFCDYCGNSLTPLYELCDTDTDEHKARQAAIKAALSTWSDDRYKYYIGETPMGTLTVTVDELYNENVGDSNGDADWLWDIRLYSSNDKQENSISHNTKNGEDIEIGKKEASTRPNGRKILTNIPLLQSDTSIKITPLMEECDGADLGHSEKQDDPNDLFCTKSGGPYFTFNLDTSDKSWKFDASSGRSGSNLSSFISTNQCCRSNSDEITVPLGESRTFYIIMKQIDDFYPESWIALKMSIKWEQEAD